jgi:hypothetical protein
MVHSGRIGVTLDLASSRWLDKVQAWTDWGDWHCRAFHRLMRCRTPLCRDGGNRRTFGVQRSISAKALDHARSFGSGIGSDQTCKWGIRTVSVTETDLEPAVSL